jgi:hypothetical protein
MKMLALISIFTMSFACTVTAADVGTVASLIKRVRLMMSVGTRGRSNDLNACHECTMSFHQGL